MLIHLKKQGSFEKSRKPKYRVGMDRVAAKMIPKEKRTRRNTYYTIL